MNKLKESFTLGEGLSEESHNDKAYFKAVFLLGGTGSGKDFVLDKVLNGHGMNEIDTDSALDLVSNVETDVPEDENERREHFRGKVKSLPELKRKLAMHGRNGVIINGSGETFDKHKTIKKALEDIGYETRAIFVACSDESSKQRNMERGTAGGRSMPEFMRKKKWTENHKNAARYRKLFGDENFIEFDNSEDLRRAAEDVRQAKAQELLGIFKVMRKFAEKKPDHPKAKEWLDNESKRTGQAINFTSTVPDQPHIPAPTPTKPGEKAKPPTPADIQKALDGHHGGAEDRDSKAAKKARKIGLSYMGYGRYGRDGHATHAATGGGQQLGFLAKESINEAFEAEFGVLNELSIPTMRTYIDLANQSLRGARAISRSGKLKIQKRKEGIALASKKIQDRHKASLTTDPKGLQFKTHEYRGGVSPAPPPKPVTFHGKAGVATYRALVIKHALLLYHNTGLKANRAYTPKNMLAAAAQITGKSYNGSGKRGRDIYRRAAEDIEEWLKKNGTSGVKESLDEVSKPILYKYIKGAWRDAQDIHTKKYFANPEETQKLNVRLQKRHNGVNRAFDQLGFPKLNEELLLGEKKKRKKIKTFNQYVPVINAPKNKVDHPTKGAASRPVVNEISQPTLLNYKKWATLSLKSARNTKDQIEKITGIPYKADNHTILPSGHDPRDGLDGTIRRRSKGLALADKRLKK